MGVCHRMFSPFSMFQWMGVRALASTPQAAGPRNWGQSAAMAPAAQRTARKTPAVRAFLTVESKQKTSYAVKRANAMNWDDYFFLLADCFANTACFFCSSALLAFDCFCVDFFWFDFGDLSPIILLFFLRVDSPAA